MDWYLSVLKKYATFSGRARRKEFWMFTLVSTLISLGLTVVDVVFGWFNNEVNIGVLSTIYSLAVLLPYTAVTARRLHDTNRSAWWMFGPFLGYMALGLLAVVVVVTLGVDDHAIGAISIVGAIAIGLLLIMVMGVAVLVFLCLDGTPGENRFGRNPKAPPAPVSGLSLAKPE